MSTKAVNIRTLAAQVTAKILSGEASLASALPPALEKAKEKDRGLLQELCYGTIRQQPLLALYSKLLLKKKPLKKKDNDIQSLILIGMYQLSFTRIPDHAAVQETVAALNDLQKSWAKGLVNGVLRQYQKQKSELDTKIKDNVVSQSIHPQWFTELINREWPEQAQAIFEANNQGGPMTLRVNQQLNDRDTYLGLLKEQGIEASLCQHSPEGIQLSKPCDVTALPGFINGKASVQDEAPQIAGALMDLKPGMKVLDACAAPGGKSCHILEIEPNISELVALDKDESRLLKVQENFTRLNVPDNYSLICADLLEVGEWWDNQCFDRILLDAPCSATGVIRRHPDIKLLRRPSDIVNLAETQLDLLQRVWPTLKSGGLMVYATCSILPAENSRVIHEFLSTCSDAEETIIDADWGEAVEHGRQLFPIINGHDGFYYCCLRKR